MWHRWSSRIFVLLILPFFCDASSAQQPEPLIKGVTGAEQKAIAKLGEDFRRKFDLPGVTLAMSYRGKLKLVACFGYADKEQKVTVEPKHQFRVASVSKPITSVTVLKLVQQKKLSLNDSVFGEEGHLRDLLKDNVTDPQQKEWVESITVRQLLQHTAGGWTNKKGDLPMFAKPALGMKHPELIAWTLQNIPLKTKPGTAYAYSNFGYCLLGRIIEEVTEKTYEEAVKELVLVPAGANATHIGGRTREMKLPDEVIYYSKYDPYALNMDVARMDSHGGWVSTPTDLVRFVQCVDGFSHPRDILRKSTLKTMTKSPFGGYALGWSVNEHDNWWHGGSFKGGTAFMVRASDGHCWAVLVNTRPADDGYRAALDQFPWAVKKAVRKWGKHDLFRE